MGQMKKDSHKLFSFILERSLHTFLKCQKSHTSGKMRTVLESQMFFANQGWAVIEVLCEEISEVIDRRISKTWNFYVDQVLKEGHYLWK